MAERFNKNQQSISSGEMSEHGIQGVQIIYGSVEFNSRVKC